MIQLIASGSVEIYDTNLMRIVSPLFTFCSLYNLFLLPILDEQFLKGEAVFSKAELINISASLKEICLGIIRLMHSDTKAQVFTNTFNSATKTNLFDVKLKTIYFTNLFQVFQENIFYKDKKFLSYMFSNRLVVSLFNECTLEIFVMDFALKIIGYRTQLKSLLKR